MEDLNLYPIDPEEVNAFLLSQELGVVVGTSCDDADCPLARFLNAQYDGSVFLVNMTEYRRLMDDGSLGCETDAVFPLPEWAQDFVYLVDHSADFEDGIPVHALDALCFLGATCSVHHIPLQEVSYV